MFRTPFICLVFLILGLIHGSWNPPQAQGHQFEDGFVERSLNVRIRDSTVQIELAIGLNDATMKSFMQAWPEDSRLRMQALARVKNPDLLANPAPATSAKNQQIDLPENGELMNELRLIRDFGEIAAPKLLDGLQVTCNGQAIKADLISAEPTARHHVTLLVTWRFELPPEEIVALKILDSNCLQQPGGAKYALKTSGTAMLLKSNVAPILVRANRLELTGLRAAERLERGTIQVKIRQFPVSASAKKFGGKPDSADSISN